MKYIKSGQMLNSQICYCQVWQKYTLSWTFSVFNDAFTHLHWLLFKDESRPDYIEPVSSCQWCLQWPGHITGQIRSTLRLYEIIYYAFTFMHMFTLYVSILTVFKFMSRHDTSQSWSLYSLVVCSVSFSLFLSIIHVDFNALL